MRKLLSMTGYGSAKGSVEGQEITVEIEKREQPLSGLFGPAAA